jgi:copper chaperone CopZ
MAVTTPFQVRVPHCRITCDGTDSFQTLFAVPMTCESCVKDVSGSLFKLSGIRKVEANLKDQLVSIEGTGSDSHSGTSATRLTDIHISGPLGNSSSNTVYGEGCNFKGLRRFKRQVTGLRVMCLGSNSCGMNRLGRLHSRDSLRCCVRQSQRASADGPGRPKHDAG